MSTPSPVAEEKQTIDTASARPSRSRTYTAGAVVVVVLAVVAVTLWKVQGRSAEVPYDDPQAAGLLTLCSADGKAVTEGSVDDRPFASVVLGQTGVPAELDPQGAVASLFAYQPREGITAAEFSGTVLTAAGTLVDPSRPGVIVSEDVWSVSDFVTAFPATDDGYVQLRLYLGTSGAGTLTEIPYDTADLRVDGDRWELVRGGHASCADAASVVRP